MVAGMAIMESPAIVVGLFLIRKNAPKAEIPKHGSNMKEVFKEATLEVPQNVFMQHGSRKGIHTEHLGYILAEMQVLPRMYPGAKW